MQEKTLPIVEEAIVPGQQLVVPAKPAVSGINSNLSAPEIRSDLVQKAQSSLLTSTEVSADVVQQLEASVAGKNSLQTANGKFSVLQAESAGLAGEIRINGTKGNDFLVGTNSDDQIFAFDGDDIVLGRAGNDQIFGGNGRDLIIASLGDDVVEGEAGNDQIFGGSGNDILNGGDGIDRILGDIGNDDINGGGDGDVLFGGVGDDRIFGGSGNDSIFGEDGNDNLNGDDGDDSVDGGKGDDIVFGGFNNDTVNGGDGNDTVIGGSGNDKVNGGNGNDTVIGVDPFIPEFGYGLNEVDTLSGGAGADTFVLGNTESIFYDNQGFGANDFATIVDFVLGQDVIQLKTLDQGENYFLVGVSDPGTNKTFTDIFVNRPYEGAEYIARVDNIQLSDTSVGFVFV
jgi:Ca2+-binding RTX toxin-like protein